MGRENEVSRRSGLALACLVLAACNPGPVTTGPTTGGGCESPRVTCNGNCTDLTSDPQNCGSCGNTCNGGGCQNSTCSSSGSGACPNDETLCRTNCTNIETDSQNCGACGRTCLSNQACQSGVCTGSCTAGQTLCNGVCTQTQVDAQNCGQCGSSCVNGATCQQGACSGTCDSPQTLCNGSCVNVLSDPNNCAGCGNSCNGQACTSGLCGGGCPSGQQMCGGSCTNVYADSNNCGTCGNVCPTDQTCISGGCYSACASGQAQCGTSGCVAIQTDPNNCGTCGNVCPSGEVCEQGQCAVSCAVGTACGGNCVNTETDPNNCGGCAIQCSLDGGEVCDSSTCTAGSAVCTQAGQVVCNGICTVLASDSANCGTCGFACPAGEQCFNGSCTLACPGGLTNCLQHCVNTFVDPGNCGGCGLTCPNGGACNAGVCANVSSSSCSTATPYGELCNGVCVSTYSDPNNCGSCGNQCQYGACSSGQCQEASNSSGLLGGSSSPLSSLLELGMLQGMMGNNSNYNRNPQPQASNPGGKGAPCQASGVSGVSQGVSNLWNGGGYAQCGTGYTCCNSTCASLQTDNANCGSCGNAVAPGAQCLNGTSTTICTPPNVMCGTSCAPPGQTTCTSNLTCKGASGVTGLLNLSGDVCSTQTSMKAPRCCSGNQNAGSGQAGVCVDGAAPEHCGNGGGCAGTPCPAGQACQANVGAGYVIVNSACACPNNTPMCGGNCCTPPAGTQHKMGCSTDGKTCLDLGMNPNCNAPDTNCLTDGKVVGCCSGTQSTECCDYLNGGGQVCDSTTGACTSK